MLKLFWEPEIKIWLKIVWNLQSVNSRSSFMQVLRWWLSVNDSMTMEILLNLFAKRIKTEIYFPDDESEPWHLSFPGSPGSDTNNWHVFQFLVSFFLTLTFTLRPEAGAASKCFSCFTALWQSFGDQVDILSGAKIKSFAEVLCIYAQVDRGHSEPFISTINDEGRSV